MNVWKRRIDLAISVPLLVLSSPLIGAAALVLRIDAPGPILYRGARVGRAGRPFTLYKLRTMRSGARGHPVTMPADARITATGRRVRASMIDELPQLVNVVRGEMSLVGPRPASPEVVAHYSARQRAVLDVAPGMISPASTLFAHQSRFLEGRSPEEMYASYLAGLLPARLEMDLRYGSTPWLRGDLLVMAKATRSVLVSVSMWSRWMQPAATGRALPHGGRRGRGRFAAWLSSRPAR